MITMITIIPTVNEFESAAEKEEKILLSVLNLSTQLISKVIEEMFYMLGKG